MTVPQHKVAVIIPSYNAERTLERTVYSVLGQTLWDIQVVIVDDGSTDYTPIIADRIAAKDSRVKVIHQNNMGSYAARIVGLRAIDASYFGFVDADDVVEPSMYETLWEYANKNTLDVVQCGIVGSVGLDQTYEILDVSEFWKRIIKPVLLQGKGAALVWDKLYRNQYDFCSLALDDYCAWDDCALNLHFFQKVSRYGIVHKGLYHYCVNSNSVTRTYNAKILAWFKNIVELRRSLAEVYRMDQYDDAIWIMRNAQNLFVMMSYVEYPLRGERYKAISQLVGSSLVEQAYATIQRQFFSNLRPVIFWFAASKCLRVSVAFIFVVKRVQQNLQRLCRK